MMYTASQREEFSHALSWNSRLQAQSVLAQGGDVRRQRISAACDSRLYVIAELNGSAVVFTYPDGYQASIEYSVEPITAYDFQRATGNSAIDELMNTAESDVKRMI